MLMPFFNNSFTLKEYLALDDGVLNTIFAQWRDYPDDILSDLANRFLDRKPLKSVSYDDTTKNLLPKLRELIQTAGFNSEYYTATNDSYNLPYDTYDPQEANSKTQIELMQPNGELVELSEVSTLVASISGKIVGNQKFFFPKEMLSADQNIEIFQPIYEEFQSYINNDEIINP